MLMKVNPNVKKITRKMGCRLFLSRKGVHFYLPFSPSPSSSPRQTQAPTVTAMSSSTNSGKQTVANTEHRNHMVLSASSSYASTASSTRGSRAQQINCVKGQATDNGPQCCPQQSAFPALGTTNVGAPGKSASGLQQQQTI